jgi:2-isopropylmalate synthase
VFEEFKALADRKKELFDGDIEALVLRAEAGTAGPWSIAALETRAGTGAEASAIVTLSHVDGRSVERKAQGDGPVDASFKALEAATGLTVKLQKFEVRSVSEGEDAQGEALVYVEYNGRTYRGSSVSTNIIESSARAFLEVINRIELSRQPSARVARERRGSKSAAEAAV